MNAELGFVGALETRKIPEKKASFLWKIKNRKSVWPSAVKHELASKLGMNHMLGKLEARRIRNDGIPFNYGVISTNMVTNHFTEFMVDQLQTETSVWGDFKFHDSGIGVTTGAVTDTVIETTDGEARATGTQTEPGAANVYVSVGTITYTSPLAITEHALFNDATTGTLMDRHTFAAINVVASDSIEFTYSLTCTAGG